MKKIVITEFMTQAAVDALATQFDVVYDKNLVDKKDELFRLASFCDAIIVRNRTQVSKELLTIGKKIKVVGRLGVGLDNIDLAACAAQSVKVIPATGANNIAVAEYVVTGILALVRGSYFGTEKVLNGAWPRTEQIGNEVCGKTLGCIGFGGIARDVARIAGVLGMKVVAHDPFIEANAEIWQEHSVTPLSLDNVFELSDAITLHIPLTDATRHIVNKDSFKKMKKGSVLINSSRGGVVDEKAMVEALHDGTLKGALVDVFENEPLPKGSVFEGAPNCILTAHIAGVTQESNERVSFMIADKVAESLNEVF